MDLYNLWFSSVKCSWSVECDLWWLSEIMDHPVPCCTAVQVYNCAGVQMCRCTTVHLYTCTSAGITMYKCKWADVQELVKRYRSWCKFASVKVFKTAGDYLRLKEDE